MGERLQATGIALEFTAVAAVGAAVGQAVVRLPWEQGIIPTEDQQEDAILSCAQALDATGNTSPAPGPCKDYAKQYKIEGSNGPANMPTAAIFLADHTLATVTDEQLHQRVEQAATWTSFSFAIVGVAGLAVAKWNKKRKG